MEVPSLFISYSHDSAQHKAWVLELATKLRGAGVDAILDQWELQAGDDLPSFMEKHLANADHILMICTEAYVQKANTGQGGVGYEKMIATSELMKNIDSNKVIPIIRQKGAHNVPTFLKSKLYIDMSTTESYEFGFDELVRKIHKSPVYKKPEIGKNPFKSGKPPLELKAEPAKDNLKEAMTLISRAYDVSSGSKYVFYSKLHSLAPMSKIMMDYLVDLVVAEGLVTQDKAKDLIITEKGRFYAIGHDIA
jgi:hypothetical protein